MLKYLDELEKDDLKGKRVLLLLDLNVPIVDGQVSDTYRIEKVIGTVDFLREKEAQIIILSHIEDKEGNPTTLLPVLDYLNGYFKVEFSKSFFTAEAVDKILKMKSKDVLLFENVRNDPGEVKNDPEFAKKLAQMADLYVNDAFSVSHRSHASIVGVPEFLPHYAGLQMRQEIEHLSKIFNPDHPFVFILGGAKFETKLPLIRKYLQVADNVFVGGALANDLFKEKGYEVGTSLVSKEEIDLKDILSSPKLSIPADVTATKDGQSVSKAANEVEKDEYISDVGDQTINQLDLLLKNARSVVWNGPLGNYEAGFEQKTESLAKMISEKTLHGGFMSIIGGGDTVAAIQNLGIDHNFSFVSTGGGAMIDFLVDETLVGIEALKK